MTDKLFLVDGSYVLFRAFFGIRRLSTRDGRPTNAIFGTYKMADKLLKEHNPEFIAFVFDTPAPTFRHERFEAYKANRPEMLKDMAVQIEPCKEMLRAMGLPVVELDGYEADDVIGTLARMALKDKMETVIATADKDLFQLVEPGVRILYSKEEGLLLDEAGVTERFGVHPDQVVDVLALWGDAGDNIPGVPGIGEKGAKALISRYGSLDEVLAHAGEVSRKAYREGLLHHSDSAMLSKELATIMRDVPIGLKPADLRRGEPDHDRLSALFKKWEFSSLTGAVPASAPKRVRTQSLALDADGVAKLKKAKWVGFSRKGESLFLSDGDDVWRSEGNLPPPDLLSHSGLCVWDIKPLLRKLDAAEISPLHNFTDAALAGYLLDPSARTPALEELSGRLLEVKAGKNDTASKAALLARLAPILLKNLEESGMLKLFKEVETPLLLILARMEGAGIKVDVPYFQKLGAEMAESLRGLEASIREVSGFDFNPASPKQVGEVLFEKLGLHSRKRTAKTRAHSTNSEVLQGLKDAHEVVPLILEHRNLSKLKGTYVDALPKWVSPRTGRVHAVFNQMVAATGRLSSSNPNMQNIPVRGEWGNRIRKGFLAEDGFVFVGADYSQVELRMLAHLSGDPVLRKIFMKGEDIHTSTASEVFNVPPDFVTPPMRHQAKAVNFGILYGQGAYGLANELDISMQEAKSFIERYFARFPTVADYLEEIKRKAEEGGWVTTILGRRRLFPSLSGARGRLRGALLRQAVNTVVQGSAADLIKKAMVDVDRALPSGARMVLQVHDELIVEAPEATAAETAEALRLAMESALELSVPLIAETKQAKRWHDLK